MDIKPILFSTPMVQAILEGRKTQTRRIIKSRHESGLFQIGKMKDGTVTEITSLDWDERPKNDCTNDIRPIVSVGDVLWVRETWQDIKCFDFQLEGFAYRADSHSAIHAEEYNIRWKPSIFMPKVAARIFLEVCSVRVERLQDISESDAKAEGVEVDAKGQYRSYTINEPLLNLLGTPFNLFCPENSFRSLWTSINGPQSWESNPWVWVYEFKRVEKPTVFSMIRKSVYINL